MARSSRGSGTFYPVDPITLNLTASVRALLPSLTRRNSRVTASICPFCGDHKDRAAKRCRACYYKQRKLIKKKALFSPIAGTQHGLGHGRKKEGVVREQPVRPRLVKRADGSWSAEE